MKAAKDLNISSKIAEETVLPKKVGPKKSASSALRANSVSTWCSTHLTGVTKLSGYAERKVWGSWCGLTGVFRSFRELRTTVRSSGKRAVAGCDAVLSVLVPWGVQQYAAGTAQAVLDYASSGARLIFSCGWHITKNGQDVYSWQLKALVEVFGSLARLARFGDLNDQVEACRRIFASDTCWTVTRGSDLEEGESQGLPVWSRHVGDPVLKSNLTRRIDFALFMVAALENGGLIHEAPAIVGCRTPSALESPAAFLKSRKSASWGQTVEVPAL